MRNRRPILIKKARKIYKKIESEEGRKVTMFDLMHRLNLNNSEASSILDGLRKEDRKKYPIVRLRTEKNIGLIELKKDFRFGRDEKKVYDVYNKLKLKNKRLPTFDEIVEAGGLYKSNARNALKSMEEKTGLIFPLRAPPPKARETFPQRVSKKIWKEAERVEETIEGMIKEKGLKTEQDIYYFIKGKLPSLKVDRFLDIGVAKEIMNRNRKKWKKKGLMR